MAYWSSLWNSSGDLCHLPQPPPVPFVLSSAKIYDEPSSWNNISIRMPPLKVAIYQRQNKNTVGVWMENGQFSTKTTSPPTPPPPLPGLQCHMLNLSGLSFQLCVSGLLLLFISHSYSYFSRLRIWPSVPCHLRYLAVSDTQSYEHTLVGAEKVLRSDTQPYL